MLFRSRRAVDYALRADLLAEIKAAENVGPAAVLDYVRSGWQKGAEKLFTLYRALACRQRLPLVFTEGEYLPLETEGPLLAFIRRYDPDWVIVAVPLIRYETPFPSRVAITLPPAAPGTWTDCFTGKILLPVGSPDPASTGRTLTWPEGLVDWPVVLATAR